MHHAQVYPDEFVKRALKHRDSGNNREQVLALLKGEFPKLAKRLDPKRLSGVYSRANYRAKCRNSCRVASIDTTEASGVNWVDLDPETKQKVYAAGRKYYDQKYRWSAIMEALEQEFPAITLPPVRLFSQWVLRKTESAREAEQPQTKPTSNFTLTISNCGSIHFEKKIAANEAKNVIMSVLGVM